MVQLVPFLPTPSQSHLFPIHKWPPPSLSRHLENRIHIEQLSNQLFSTTPFNLVVPFNKISTLVRSTVKTLWQMCYELRSLPLQAYLSKIMWCTAVVCWQHTQSGWSIPWLSWIVLSFLAYRRFFISFLKSAILLQSCHTYLQELLWYKIFPLNINSYTSWHTALLGFVRNCKRNGLPAISRHTCAVRNSDSEFSGIGINSVGLSAVSR